MNLKLKHEDLVPNYNAIITLIFIFYYRLHCFSVPTTPEQRKTTSSSLLLVVLTDDKAIKEPRTVDQTDRIIC